MSGRAAKGFHGWRMVAAGSGLQFLQAGLMVPLEEESLTTRATREALAKLDADPARLLQ